MPPSNTRLDVEEEVVRIFSQLDESTRLDPVPLIGTISAVGTITAPMLDRGTLQANRYDGRLIKVAEDATAVAFVTPVTVTGVHTAVITTLTVSSTAEIRSGDILEIGTTLEKVLVRAVVNATTLTVTRGFQGTTATTMAGANTVQYDPYGYVTGVDDGGFAATGVLTISPNFAVAGYGAGSFYMYPKGLNPDYVVEKLNAVLRNTDHPQLWFPSLCPDSDFASADVANWAVVAAATRAFTTTAASILLGERALTVTAAAAADSGVESVAWSVTENEQMLVQVPIQATATDPAAAVAAKVILRRVTTTASNLRTVTSLNERSYVNVLFRERIPDGCQRVSLRFLSAAASAVFNISPYIVAQSDRRRSYETPSWFTRPSQLKEILYYPAGYNSDEADSYVPLSEREWAGLEIDFLRSERDSNPLRVQFCNQGSYPVGFMVMRPFVELGGDSTTTVCDKDYLAFKTVSNILRDRRDNAWKHWAERASTIAKIKGYGQREIQAREQLTYAGSY